MQQCSNYCAKLRFKINTLTPNKGILASFIVTAFLNTFNRKGTKLSICFYNTVPREVFSVSNTCRL